MKILPKSEPEIFHLLSEKYPLPEWVLIPGVRETTGGYCNRTADAIAINCYPSRGLEVNGFEIKSSRVDWKREKKNPDKASIQRYCHRWWLVTGAVNIAQECEVPLTWGLMVPHGTGLRIIKQAPLLKPKQPDMGFVASLLRNIVENNKGLVPRTEFEIALAKRLEIAKGSWQENNKWELKNLRDLKDAIQNFEKMAGVQIDKWNAGNIGKVVKMVLDNRGQGMLRCEIISQKQCAERGVALLKEATEQLERLLAEVDKTNV